MSVQPWHKIAPLREDLLSGDLPMNLFAADLHDVVLNQGPDVYRDPARFFAFTYASGGMRQMAREVVHRLAGKSDKAVQQLAMTYGGGKTHTLITLFHLVNKPESLPDLPTLGDFKAEIGAMDLPKARVAVLPFDKIDDVVGMDALSPQGEIRRLKYPWSVLAWQLGGEEALRKIHGGKSEERETPPAETLLREVLSMPAKEGLAVLVLMDEVLIYAHAISLKQGGSIENLKNFFQFLTQAAVKTPRCCVTASLLASNTELNTSEGKKLEDQLATIFNRESERQIQPVTREESAEVLKRRLFQENSWDNRERFRAQVIASLKGIGGLDEATRKEGDGAVNRYLQAYPFHPDLTEAFYGKWAGMSGFQKTRGVLRTFAMALREAAAWGDPSPIIGPQVLLAAPDSKGLSGALTELSDIARREDGSGPQSHWPFILSQELSKAKSLQSELPGLRNREAEQIVMSVFLHSQPIGSMADQRDVAVLVGGSQPDRISFEKALLGWKESSWFLDDGNFPRDPGEMPKKWRLGSRPNIKQMHDLAFRDQVKEEEVSELLENTLEKTRELTEGARGLGAKVHPLPIRPADIPDDGDFHYAVLRPNAVSSSGNPSIEAKRFIEETTTPDRPRAGRNAVLLVAPSREGLESVRNAARSALAWDVVLQMLKKEALDPHRQGMVAGEVKKAGDNLKTQIRQAWSIIITLSDKNEIQAYKLSWDNDSLFLAIKNDPRARIAERALSPDALLPGGPFANWAPGEIAKRVPVVVSAFAEVAKLPKMLDRKGIFETLAQGAHEGFFVLKQTREGQPARTFWRQDVPIESLEKESGWEMVLPEAAELADLPSSLMAPEALPGLWPAHGALTLTQAERYFEGGKSQPYKRRMANGQEVDETLIIPKLGPETVKVVISQAVEQEKIWLVTPVASIWGEPIPAGIFNDDGQLLRPPSQIDVTLLKPDGTPSAWAGNETNGLALHAALSGAQGRNLPWKIVAKAIDSALTIRMLERLPDSGPWPCPFPSAQTAKFKMAQVGSGPPPGAGAGGPSYPLPSHGTLVARRDLTVGEIQNLAEELAELKRVTKDYGLKVLVSLEIGGANPVPSEKLKEINTMLGRISKGWQVG